jgi:hypothetical protein
LKLDNHVFRGLKALILRNLGQSHDLASWYVKGSNPLQGPNPKINVMETEKIKKLKIAANQFYLNLYPEVPRISDQEYDALEREYYEATGQRALALVDWDITPRVPTKPVPKVNKVIVQDNDLEKAVRSYLDRNNITDYMIFFKYDGCSIQCEYVNGRKCRITSTPSSDYAMVRTESFFDLFPDELPDKSITCLRGEVLVDYRPYGEKARNVANGLTNSKYQKDKVNKEALIRIYGIDFEDGIFDYDRYKKALKSLPTVYMDRGKPFLIPVSKAATDLSIGNTFPKKSLVDFIPNEHLEPGQERFESLSPDKYVVFDENVYVDHIQVDGVVVYSKKEILAFKFYFTESATTTVRDIIWNKKPNGSYAPVLRIDPIVLNDKSINNVSANGVPSLMSGKWGIGAEIEVILANLTIPKAVRTFKGSEDYKFPKCECGYKMSKNDIYGATLKCGNKGVCSDRLKMWLNPWMNKLNNEKEKNPNFNFQEYVESHILQILTVLNIDRWGAGSMYKYQDKLKVDREETLREIGSEIYYYIYRNDFDGFKDFILQNFNFTQLSRKLFDINARTSFEVLVKLLEEFGQIITYKK